MTKVHPPRALVLQILEAAVDSAVTGAEWNRHSTWTQRRGETSVRVAPPSSTPQCVYCVFRRNRESETRALSTTQRNLVQAAKRKTGQFKYR
jgi:hypothetical protein